MKTPPGLSGLMVSRDAPPPGASMKVNLPPGLNRLRAMSTGRRPLAWFDEPSAAFFRHGIGAACWRTWAPLAKRAKFGTLPHDPAGRGATVLLVLLPHDLADNAMARLFCEPHPDGPEGPHRGRGPARWLRRPST